jgi:formamidopyrimidine-DNA glycosylase
MPELPEVETIKNDLIKLVLFKTIERVEIFSEDIIKYPEVSLFKEKIKDCKIRDIMRRGKYLIFNLSSLEELVIHLKLTGQIIYREKFSKEKFTKIIFYLKESGLLYFNDKRGFAEIYLIPQKNYDLIPGLKNLGVEPFSNEFTYEVFEKIVKNSSSNIKSLLIDQEKIAGVGNIYANESLFLARINPKRISHTLTSGEIQELYRNLLSVLKKAIKERGTSIDTYVDLKGNKGNFKPIVYGNEGIPCPNCGTAIKKININSRPTYFCQKCQR